MRPLNPGVRSSGITWSFHLEIEIGIVNTNPKARREHCGESKQAGLRTMGQKSLCGHRNADSAPGEVVGGGGEDGGGGAR